MTWTPVGLVVVFGLGLGCAGGCADDASTASGEGTGGDSTAASGGNGGNDVSGGSGGSGGNDGSGGGSDDGTRDGGQPDATVGDGLEIRLPPTNPGLDYQLGGAYPPPMGVQVLSRDRLDAPAPGLYNICYLNGLQTQPGEEGDWEPDLILREPGGAAVIDPDWNELLLDVSTADKRTRIAAVIGGWIRQCATDGFDAVEIDNLDTYSRSGGRISQDHAVRYMALLSAQAHAQGLAIAQKNSTEIRQRRAEMGTDFAVAEECSRYDECGDYIDAYGDAVLMIEYRDADFTKGCQAHGNTHGIVRRDLNLVPPGQGSYVYQGC